MIRRLTRSLSLALAFLVIACTPPSGDDAAVENLPPQTHISVGFFRADSTSPDTMDLTISRVGLSWWGEDADGWIDHYQYRWQNDIDSLGQPYWTNSESESDTFVVRLEQDTMLVRFEVRAWDNRGLVDPSPAVTTFPAYNQKPRLDWVAQSQEILNPGFTADTSWTFPYNSFHFNAWDMDGNETITEVVWALDDTTNWAVLPEGMRAIRLDPEALTPGTSHRIFIKAKDNVNAWSDLLTYPRASDTTSTGDSQVWMVGDLAGDLLMILDNSDPSEAEPFLKAGLSGMGYEENVNYTWWHATNWIPYDEEDLIAVFDEFPMIFWASWRVTQLEDVCGSLDRYQANGGHLLITTTDVGYFSTSWELPFLYDAVCVPIDSLTHQRRTLWHPVNGHEDPLTPAEGFADRYPTLYVTERISFQGSHPADLYFGFVPDDSCAVELFFVPENPEDPEDNPRITVGARTAAPAMPDKAKQVYLSLPLWKIDDLPALFEVLIHDEFNW
jgi:hypothetical protein